MPNPASQKLNWQHHVVVAALLAIVTAAAYCRVSGNAFVSFDDNMYITENYRVRDGLTGESIKWAFTQFHAANWHPLTWLSHMLDIELFGMWAGGHHMTNLAIHIANALLLFGFLYRTTGRTWTSAFVAALFALHPLNVESVAWASSRKNTLSTFFWLATMWTWFWYAARPGLRRYLCVAAVFALGLMAKPMLVTLPVALLLLDYWPLNRFEFTKGWLRRVPVLAAEKLPLLAMTAAASAVTVAAQQVAMAPLEYSGMGFRIANALVSYGRYIWMMFWPAGLAAYYPPQDRPLFFRAVVMLVLMVAATVAAWRLRKRHKYVLFGWLWYLGTLVPVIGIVQVGLQTHADRYTYIPLMGLFVIIAWAAGDFLARRPSLRKHAAVSAGAVLIVLAAMTWRTVGFWKDNITLSSRAIAVTQNNYLMMTNLAVDLIGVGRIDEAEALLLDASRIAPGDYHWMYGMGCAALAEGRLEDALNWLGKAIRSRPDIMELHSNSAMVLIMLERYDEAEAYVRRAIELSPNSAHAHAQLAVIMRNTGRYAESEAISLHAASLRGPGSWLAHSITGQALIRQGQFEEAAAELRKAVEIRPDAVVLTNLGGCLMHLGKVEEAEKAFREATVLNPKYALGQFNLAVVLAELGRTQEAAETMAKVLELEPDNRDAKEFLKFLGGM
ncbi:MAG TPA: tetratricopeptide repeat protein [Sedimentisphaerales bacterium]|nr:tetratricopeptide repeat protein [Sedimentisphaerales bacterium]